MSKSNQFLSTPAQNMLTCSSYFVCVCQVLESVEEEVLREKTKENSDDGGQFDVIPPYSERATVSNLGSGAGGAATPSTGPPPPILVLLLLLTASLSWG